MCGKRIDVRNFLYKLFFFLFSNFPIKRNKIFFIGYYGSQYGCSPKYLSEYIVRTYPNWDVVWAFTDPEAHVVQCVRVVKYRSLRYFYELYTSRVIVTNYRMTEDFQKRKGQYYVMTWHSSLRLKKIEGDVEGSLPQNYVEMAKADSKKIDLLLSGCRFSDEIFQRAFWYNGVILQSGTPRCDIFYGDNIKEQQERIKNDLKIEKQTKILLYAPTFRKNESFECYNLNYDGLVECLEKKGQEKWIVLVRLHPHLQAFSKKLLRGNNVVDVTRYDDIQELLLVADILITDYSSLMFDYAETRRPCFLYAPDLNEYQKNDRTLYFDIKKLPFPVSLTQDNLEWQINNMNKDSYVESINKFLQDIGSYEDGEASKRVSEYIQQWMI